MPKCAGVIERTERGDKGRACQRWAVKGSQFCFAHGGVKTSTTPEAIEHRPRNPGVMCNARMDSGDPCGNFAIKGGTVCLFHGGKTKHTRQAAILRMLEYQLEAIGVVGGALSNPEYDPALRLKAAQLILDRTGMGPSSKLEQEVAVKPFEQLLKGVEVARDLALPAAEEWQPEIVEAEVVEEERDPTENFPGLRVVGGSEGSKVAAFPNPPSGVRFPRE